MDKELLIDINKMIEDCAKSIKEDNHTGNHTSEWYEAQLDAYTNVRDMINKNIQNSNFERKRVDI
jgi:hypothetical protein